MLVHNGHHANNGGRLRVSAALGGQMHPVAHKEDGGSQSPSYTGRGREERGTYEKKRGAVGCRASESLVHDMVVILLLHRAAGTAVHFFCIRLRSRELYSCVGVYVCEREGVESRGVRSVVCCKGSVHSK